MMDYKEAWEDLRAKLKAADKRLKEIDTGDFGKLHGKHLKSKAEGVRLALSYMDDNERIFKVAENDD